MEMEINHVLREYAEAYSSDYEECREDLRFASLLQYKEKQADDIKLVFDRINRIKNRIVNPCRINPFGFGVSFFGVGDATRAARLNAFFDAIQSDTNAYSVFADALDIALMCGRAYIVIGNDYIDERSLDQKIVITCPIDPTTVFIDPASTAVDGSDIEHAAQVSFISKSAAKRKYGLEDDALKRSLLPSGFDLLKRSDMTELIAYWRKESKRNHVAYIQDTQSGRVITVPIEQVKEMLSANLILQEQILGDRRISDVSIKYELWCGENKITESVLPIRYIPVVPVYGKRVYLQDRITYKGLSYLLRDIQRVINFAASAEAYRLNNAPIAPYIAEYEQVMDGGAIQRMWENVNRERRGALIYRRVDGVPPPTRADVSPQTAEIQVTRKGLQVDADESLGFGASDFGNAIGAKNASGLALSIMQEVSDYQTACWTDNLKSSVIQVGRIVSELAPLVYSEGIRVSYFADGKRYSEIVRADELTGSMRFVITASPEGAQKKRHGAQILATLAGQNQDFARAFSDIILQNSGVDIPEDAIERARKMIPSHLIGQSPDPETMQTLQAMQASMDEMAKTIEQYEAIISQLQAKILGDTRKSEIEYIKEQLKIIGDMLIEQQKQKGKLDAIEAKAVADVVRKTSEAMINESNAMKENVEIKYSDPIDQFTPLVPGPLVVGDTTDQTASTRSVE